MVILGALGCGILGLAALTTRGVQTTTPAPAPQATSVREQALETDIVERRYTATPTASHTPSPTPTPSHVELSDCQLGAAFEADMTIPDNAPVALGEGFVKTWRLRNTGTCQWGPGFRFAFLEGDRMDAPDAVAVPHTKPDETGTVSVRMTAPTDSGRYRSVWQTCVNEECFGEQVYVQIVAEPPTSTPTPTPTRNPPEIIGRSGQIAP